MKTAEAQKERIRGQETRIRDSETFIQEMTEECCVQAMPHVKKMGETIFVAEPFSAQERLILFGGGHVSLALAEFGAKIGFSVVVADDRPFFANRTRFPWAEQILCDDFSNAVKKVRITSSDYVVILTRGHRYDGECLRNLYKEKESAYLGMIGSRRRVKSLKEQLEEEGIEREWLERLHSPVGLDIGAVTPEEIAISILAEIIENKRKTKDGSHKVLQSDIDMRVMDHLACPPENLKEVKKAIVTILETKGSVPRKAGAKMIVYENGLLSGTIGGGCTEADIMGKAREIIGTGSYEICEVDMTGDIAEEEGMVCGGTMKVLVEDGEIQY
jgi:xanthine dehydrogenase accessory factor